MSSLNRKITANKSKNLLVENELKKLKTFDLSYFIGKSHFEEDGNENYLVFSPIQRYFKLIPNTHHVSSWKSKGLSDKTIKPPATFDIGLSPLIDYLSRKIRLTFNRSCLKQPNVLYIHGTIVTIYTDYELGAFSSNENDPTLKNSLFPAVKLTTNADINKYQYFGYGIGFDRKSFPVAGFGQNAIIFGVDMSSSANVDNKKKDILIIGKGLTQRLEHTLTAEKMHSTNFTVTKNKFCLILHHNCSKPNMLRKHFKRLVSR